MNNKMGSALKELRSKYVEDLEEILQCPVCFNRVSAPVPTCVQGHHVCQSCQPRVDNCPLCKNCYLGSRNYLAEALASKFDEIMSSLRDPKERKHPIIKNKKCAETQTEPAFFNGKGIDSVVEMNGIPPTVGKGKYPCRIDNCGENFPHGRMLPHLRYYHQKHLIEENVTSNPYTSEWDIEYNLPSTFVKAITIPNMGMFFVNVDINKEGDLCGNVQIVNSCMVAKEFEYTLDVRSSRSSTCYKGLVIPCRTETDKHRDKSLFINNLFMSHLMKKKTTFKCHLILKRLP